jgi:hypothetical protein
VLRAGVVDAGGVQEAAHTALEGAGGRGGGTPVGQDLPHQGHAPPAGAGLHLLVEVGDPEDAGGHRSIYGVGQRRRAQPRGQVDQRARRQGAGDLGVPPGGRERHHLVDGDTDEPAAIAADREFDGHRRPFGQALEPRRAPVGRQTVGRHTGLTLETAGGDDGGPDPDAVVVGPAAQQIHAWMPPHQNAIGEQPGDQAAIGSETESIGSGQHRALFLGVT